MLHSSLPGLEDFRRERGEPERRCVIDAASGVDLDRNDSSPATLLRIKKKTTTTTRTHTLFDNVFYQEEVTLAKTATERICCCACGEENGPDRIDAHAPHKIPT